MFTIVSGRHLRRRTGFTATEPALDGRFVEAPSLPPEATARLQKRFQIRLDKRLAERQPTQALILLHDARSQGLDWQLAEPDQGRLIDQLCAAHQEEDAVPLLEDYLRRFKSHASPGRLKLAQTLIEPLQRPRYALRLLEAVGNAPLAPKHQMLHTTLARKAHRMIAEGVFEPAVGPQV
ncbi:MAG: hypothetical protein ACKV0T_06650 [Planctomycetales bacterium]